MNTINAVRLRNAQGGLSNQIPISTTVENIMYDSTLNTKQKIEEIVGIINQLQNRPTKDQNNILVF